MIGSSAGIRALSVAAGLGAGLFAPRAAHAQAALFLRLAPEAAQLSMEHRKVVADGAGPGASASATSSSALAFAATASAGLSARLPSGLFVGAEVQGVLADRRKIEGTIMGTPDGNVYDVWPGAWDFHDRYGVGGNAFVGIDLGAGGARGYVFGGMRRMWSEFATSGVNPATGISGESREVRARKPTTIGVGLTFDLGMRLDVRLGYSRSHLEWTVDFTDVIIDYGYTANGVTLSAAIGAPG